MERVIRARFHGATCGRLAVGLIEATEHVDLMEDILYITYAIYMICTLAYIYIYIYISPAIYADLMVFDVIQPSMSLENGFRGTYEENEIDLENCANGDMAMASWEIH